MTVDGNVAPHMGGVAFLKSEIYQRGWLEAGLAEQRPKIRSLRESEDRAVRESHYDHTLQNSVRHGGNIPRTLTVDANLLERHLDSAIGIVEQVLRAEDWARQHQEETRLFLARETNSSEYYVRAAYGENAHERLRTDFAEQSVLALQDFSDFLLRWQFIPARVDAHPRGERDFPGRHKPFVATSKAHCDSTIDVKRMTVHEGRRVAGEKNCGAR
jgi:hypothetical protein